ncbi:asialoglycoprotein receptor 1-like isoform X2 [Aquila chrysaetos chrysaetos]|uniref:asialoglycoprotein receptor 1-like isoform X2 n=1 Tax=Aquila chrysaetos chrysaetos TaxID=223781 RepID=UPI0005D0C99B|nr:asialoglycoprotein receptor 1-like isoform X2 [Aquila chrysaetos chrysaetos]
MSQREDAVGTYEKWDFAEGTELEKEEQRKPKGENTHWGASYLGLPHPISPLAMLSILALSLERAVVLLYVLLALTFVLFMALTIVNLQRACELSGAGSRVKASALLFSSPVSAAWEVLEQARIRSENSHTTAWHNLSEVQRALDKQLSGELKVIHSRLLNVSQEVENVRWKMTQCKEECGKELSDRLRVLEERDGLEAVLRQLAEVKQEQSHASALLDVALEETRNLSEIICTRCPAGWQQFAKTCYFFSSTTKPWLAAKDFCTNFNSHLAIVNTEQENKFLANHIMDHRVFWLGLTDMHTEGNWKWVDGSILSLSFWNSGEPNNVGHQGEDCATIYSSGHWNDATCSNAEPWVCERSC